MFEKSTDNIKLLVLDVDGVLTDGNLIINPDGRESKTFNTVDGHGIRMYQRAGGKVAIISGRFSEPVKYRAEQLEIEYVFQDCHFKLPVMEKLLEKLSLTFEQAAYIGDDLPDLPIVRKVGLGIAVNNAVEELKKEADYITSKPGGKGAVREGIELILKNSSRWNEAIKRYYT